MQRLALLVSVSLFGVSACAPTRVASAPGDSWKALVQVTRCTERKGACRTEEEQAWPSVKQELDALRASPEPVRAYALLRDLIRDGKRQASRLWMRELLVELRREAQVVSHRADLALLPNETERVLQEVSSLFFDLGAYPEATRYAELAGSSASAQALALAQSAAWLEQQGQLAAATEQLCRAAERSRERASEIRQHCASLTAQTVAFPLRVAQVTSSHSEIEQAFVTGLGLTVDRAARWSIEVQLSGKASDVFGSVQPCRPMYPQWDMPAPCGANPALPMCRPPAVAAKDCRIRTTTTWLAGKILLTSQDGMQASFQLDGAPQTLQPMELSIDAGTVPTDIRLVAAQRGGQLQRSLLALGVAWSVMRAAQHSPAHEDHCARLRLLPLYPYELSAFDDIAKARQSCGPTPRLFP